MLDIFFTNRAIKALCSLRVSVWLLAIQLVLFAAGAVKMPGSEAYGLMNSMPLMDWMTMAPAGASWWLWASLVVMAALALNTTLCTLEALLRKPAGRSWASIIPAHVIHIGFLIMMAGHLASSTGALHITHPMREGSAVMLPDRSYMRLAKVDLKLAPEGYPLDWSAELEYYSPEGRPEGRGVSAPNRPHFRKGIGVYIKQAAYGGALMEIHREPGTPWALGGGALFAIGTVALMAIKMRRER